VPRGERQLYRLGGEGRGTCVVYCIIAVKVFCVVPIRYSTVCPSDCLCRRKVTDCCMYVNSLFVPLRVRVCMRMCVLLYIVSCSVLWLSAIFSVKAATHFADF
jgi:hypothetical protein